MNIGIFSDCNCACVMQPNTKHPTLHRMHPFMQFTSANVGLGFYTHIETLVLYMADSIRIYTELNFCSPESQLNSQFISRHKYTKNHLTTNP